jgi:hypothetical protein
MWARRHLQARDEGDNERFGVPGDVRGHVLRVAVAVVRFRDGDGARIGSAAMIAVGDEAIPGALAVAIENLDVASRDLDDAMLALSAVAGDDVMVSSSLSALLLRAMKARRHVNRLQLDVKAAIRSRVRASSVS